jgi:acetyl esterase/lipase
MITTLYRLDLYIPEDNSRPCPVVAFVTGGAWIIGLVLMILKGKKYLQ